ncbi:hypothetical protein Ddye_018183 [Dipteronia dyeriana]|uniref:BED-type domain-containing protein n=1 Tax=Dipteronia dyeriana TaxID=168575 RepID=A0AAD9UAL4_9ROSI|nr:hypothetical protein Ddye_018183 [Dipteronia dyeriana]
MPNSFNSIATENETSSGNTTALNVQAPLWKYATKLDEMGKGGENVSFRCNFCLKEYKGSYSRVKNHLMKIRETGISSYSRVTNAKLLEMQKVVEEAELRAKQSLPSHVSLPNTPSHDKAIGSSSSDNYTNFPSHELKKRKGMVGPLEKAFNIAVREKFDGEIARMFYMGGLSFHFARNPYYVRAFTNALPGYVPPGYNALRTTLLQKDISNIGQLLAPIKGT